jgi:hypothetical protein
LKAFKLNIEKTLKGSKGFASLGAFLTNERNEVLIT